MGVLDGPGTGYGPGDRGRPRRVSRTTILLVSVALAVLVVLGLTFLSPNRHQGDIPPALSTSSATPSGSTSASTPATSSSTPAATALPGDDASTLAGAPPGLTDAVGAFLVAWQDPDRDSRVDQLQWVATPRLAKALANVDPAKIPTATPQPTPAIQASDYAATVDQPMSDGTTVRLQLVVDPGSRYGWLVDTISQAG